MLPIAPGRFQIEPDGPQRTDGHERQTGEPDQRGLLRQLVQRNLAHREHRYPVDAVDLVHPFGVGTEQITVEITASHDDDRVAIEAITGTDVPLLHPFSLPRYDPNPRPYSTPPLSFARR